MSFGGWLLDALAKEEMDQAELARRLGVGTGTVSRWANDRVTPSAMNIVDIARALRLPPAEVLSRATGGTVLERATPDAPSLPPNLTPGEIRLVERLAWSVRQWREDENAKRDGTAGENVA